MKRRDFLKLSGTFLATAAVGIGCSDDKPVQKPPAEKAGTYAFTEGVASGDPRESSVVLWTRATRTAGGVDPVALTAEVATDEGFTRLVAMQTMMATTASDFTVRLLVDKLAAATTYYYRFVAGSDTSTVGRTRTAPARGDDARVNFAFVSCQDYQAGFYGAWRRMIVDDAAAAAADQIQFVVHLGDFIYETRGSGFQTALDDSFMPLALTGADGKPRTIDPFPDGATGADGNFAVTLADYRHLYRQFLRDPDLRDARARWPIVSMWDDHEFSNDCWQTQANYDNKKTYDEPSQKRRVSATQAFFEFIPLDLSSVGDVTGVDSEAHTFQAVTVMDAPYGDADVSPDNFITEPNNVAAIGALTVYRSLRFGKHVELILTDERSYRSDHAIPEEITASSPLFFVPRNAVPLEMVNTMDAGKTANKGSPPSTVLGFPNARAKSPAGTMLGAKQKAWWKKVVKGSDATWRVWGNEVALTRTLLNVGKEGVLPYDLLADADSWDGYPTERRELTRFLVDNDVRNVVSVAGDIHSHWAGTIYDDFDDPAGKPALVEFVAAGMTSNTFFSFFEGPTRSLDFVRSLVTYDSTKLGGTEKFVRNLNTSLLWGVKSAKKAAETNDPRQAEAVRDPSVNPQLAYLDTDARGYGLVRVTGTELGCTLVTIPSPTKDYGAAGAPIVGKASFTVQPTPIGQRPSLAPPVLEGKKPFPLT